MPLYFGRIAQPTHSYSKKRGSGPPSISLPCVEKRYPLVDSGMFVDASKSDGDPAHWEGFQRQEQERRTRTLTLTRIRVVALASYGCRFSSKDIEGWWQEPNNCQEGHLQTSASFALRLPHLSELWTWDPVTKCLALPRIGGPAFHHQGCMAPRCWSHFAGAFWLAWKTH